MDPLELLGNAQASAQAVIDQAAPEHLVLMTPCEGWNVAMLLDKMVTSPALLGTLCRGEEPGPELNLWFPTELGRADGSASFRVAAKECLNAFDNSKLEGEMMGPLGVMIPKKGGLMIRVTDCTVNTWDLARSIGVEPEIDEAVLGPVIEFATGFFPKVREKHDHVRFATATEFHGEDKLAQLVALSGRDPDWQPSNPA